MQRNDPHLAREDLAIRDRVLAGDLNAADELFGRHLDPLYRFVHYRLGPEAGGGGPSVSSVEDVVQDTLLVAVERLAAFDGRSSLHTWLCGIAKNKIRARRRKRRPKPLEDVLADSDDDIDRILTQVASEPLPEWVLEQRETRDLVGATLSSLPPDYAETLVGKYVEDRTVAEIAARTGSGVKATESRLTRARLAFARVFELLAKRRGGDDDGSHP